MFSKTCEYAIRAVLFIAQKSEDGKRVNIKSIAKNNNSPESFIAKILQQLTKRGIVQSVKGPNGGFFVNEKSKENSIADIVKAIDGEELFVNCALGLSQCSEEYPCPIHHEYKKIKQQITQMLESAKVSDLSDDLEQKLTFLKKA